MSKVDEDLRAKHDAFKDMEQEGLKLDEENLRSKFVESMQIQFSASFYVRNTRTGEKEHGITKHTARTPEESLGKMYMELSDCFPTEDGWLPPSIILDPEPVLLCPGLGMPLGVDMAAIFDRDKEEDAEGVASCPTCGDPQGPCEDPDMCLQNPNPGGRGEPVVRFPDDDFVS